MNDKDLTQSPTLPLLRPPQVREFETEKQVLTAQLKNPDVADKGLVQKQLNKLDRQLASQAPIEPSAKEKDYLASEIEEMEDSIRDGMLSSEEMRRNPAGAVGAHLAWEKSKKAIIQRWKNFKLRLNTGTDDPDIANIERLRPLHRHSGFSMDTVQIDGKNFFFPSGDIPIRNVMSDADKASLGIPLGKGKSEE